MQRAKTIHRLTAPHSPSIPKIQTPPQGAIEADLLAALKPWQQTLDQFAAHTGAGGAQPVLDFKFHKGVVTLLASDAFKLTWPNDLFIPGTAD
jgi:hypothetical protein